MKMLLRVLCCISQYEVPGGGDDLVSSLLCYCCRHQRSYGYEVLGIILRYEMELRDMFR